jgi:hypothetical protein
VIVSVALSDAIAPPAVPTLKTPMTLPFPLIIEKLLTETSQLLIMKARPKIANVRKSDWDLFCDRCRKLIVLKLFAPESIPKLKNI